MAHVMMTRAWLNSSSLEIEEQERRDRRWTWLGKLLPPESTTTARAVDGHHVRVGVLYLDQGPEKNRARRRKDAHRARPARTAALAKLREAGMVLGTSFREDEMIEGIVAEAVDPKGAS